MSRADELRALAERVYTSGSDNSLDVLCEIALFKPGRLFSAVRANSARTKVIFTQASGSPDVTCWAQNWTDADRRASTVAALLALVQEQPK